MLEGQLKTDLITKLIQLLKHTTINRIKVIIINYFKKNLMLNNNKNRKER